MERLHCQFQVFWRTNVPERYHWAAGLWWVRETRQQEEIVSIEGEACQGVVEEEEWDAAQHCGRKGGAQGDSGTVHASPTTVWYRDGAVPAAPDETGGAHTDNKWGGEQGRHTGSCEWPVIQFWWYPEMRHSSRVANGKFPPLLFHKNQEVAS